MACCCGDGLLPRPSKKRNPYAEILLDALQASKVETNPHGRHIPRADMLINYILLVLLIVVVVVLVQSAIHPKFGQPSRVATAGGAPQRNLREKRKK